MYIDESVTAKLCFVINLIGAAAWWQLSKEDWIFLSTIVTGFAGTLQFIVRACKDYQELRNNKKNGIKKQNQQPNP